MQTQPDKPKQETVIIRGRRSSERYEWDFTRCKRSDGWLQYDTRKDAWYYGIWYHPGKRLVFSYVEGDMDLIYCPTDEGWRAELEAMARFHGPAPRCAVALHQDGSRTEYFDEEARPDLSAALPERIPVDLAAEAQALGFG